MKTVVIIQARVGSTRLPGKVMMNIEGKPILQHVIERCKRIPGVKVVCCFPKEDKSISMVNLSMKLDVPFFLGSELDVLDRYYYTAKHFGAEVILRVTADCPLIDPEICHKVIRLRERKNVAYASNVHPRSYPHGLDCEAFTMSSLIKAWEEANDREREHVTTWIYTNMSKANLSSGDPSLASHRWTVDYLEDLRLIRAIYRHGNPRTMDDVIDTVEAHPEINKINANRKVAA